MLRAFDDTTYSLTQVSKYLSFGVSGIALLLFLVGYFGAKLVALESIAVVQLSALLMVSLEDMSPPFGSLSYLSYSLGETKIKYVDPFF